MKNEQDMYSDKMLLSKWEVVLGAPDRVNIPKTHPRRKQFVEFENMHTDVPNINLCVPQGSVLRPLLFIFISMMVQLPVI